MSLSALSSWGFSQAISACSPAYHAQLECCCAQHYDRSPQIRCRQHLICRFSHCPIGLNSDQVIKASFVWSTLRRGSNPLVNMLRSWGSWLSAARAQDCLEAGVWVSKTIPDCGTNALTLPSSPFSWVVTLDGFHPGRRFYQM